MAAGGPRCGSDCGIVLTPAQVIMDCYLACQSARSRLLRQLLLLVTNPSLQKASYSKHHVASAREMRLAGHSLPRGSPKKKKIQNGSSKSRLSLGSGSRHLSPQEMISGSKTGVKSRMPQPRAEGQCVPMKERLHPGSTEEAKTRES